MDENLNTSDEQMDTDLSLEIPPYVAKSKEVSPVASTSEMKPEEIYSQQENVKTMDLDKQSTENKEDKLELPTTIALDPPPCSSTRSQEGTECHNTPDDRSISSTRSPEEELELYLKSWHTVDDVALIEGLLHVYSLTAVFESTVFSKEYEIGELEERWNRLMYDEKFASQAKRRINELTPEQILFVQAKVPFSKKENAVLMSAAAKIKEINIDGKIINPSILKIEDFTAILKTHRNEFHPARTPQVLMDQYKRHIHGQDICNGPDWERIEMTMLMNNDLSFDYLRPLRAAQNRGKAIAKTGILAKPMAASQKEKLVNNGLAMLKGKSIRYVIMSDYVTIGRSTIRDKVDVDLNAEVASGLKISRRQAIIELDRSIRRFKIKNVGQRTMFVDGKPVPTFMSCFLKDNSIIEVATVQLVFKIAQKAQISPRFRAAISNMEARRKQLGGDAGGMDLKYGGFEEDNSGSVVSMNL